jgi:hypothetical protein
VLIRCNEEELTTVTDLAMSQNNSFESASSVTMSPCANQEPNNLALDAPELDAPGGASPEPSLKPLSRKPLSTSGLYRPSLDRFLRHSSRFMQAHRYSNNGPLVQEMEHQLATFHEVRHCIAMSNGSPKLFARNNFWNQVGRTINGIPITDSNILEITRSIRSQLSLSQDDSCCTWPVGKLPKLPTCFQP